MAGTLRRRPTPSPRRREPKAAPKAPTCCAMPTSTHSGRSTAEPTTVPIFSRRSRARRARQTRTPSCAKLAPPLPTPCCLAATIHADTRPALRSATTRQPRGKRPPSLNSAEPGSAETDSARGAPPARAPTASPRTPASCWPTKRPSPSPRSTSATRYWQPTRKPGPPRQRKSPPCTKTATRRWSTSR